MILNILLWTLMGIALIASTVGGIWFLVAAFRVHVLWGLVLLFFPILGIVFLITHWEDAKKPFFINLCSTILFIAAFSVAIKNSRAAADGTPELEPPSFTETINKIKENAAAHKPRKTAPRGYLGTPLDVVEAELGEPQAKMKRGNQMEYQYTEYGLTLISSDGKTVTDEIRK